MKKFEVEIQIIGSGFIEIEAETPEAARKLAENLQAEAFVVLPPESVDDSGFDRDLPDLEILSVEELVEKP